MRIEVYNKYHNVVSMVANKFKFNLCIKGLERNDVKQAAEMIYIRTIQKMDINKASNVGAYLWKAVYRQLKTYIEKNDYLLCCDVLDESYDQANALDIQKDIDMMKLAAIMQELLERLDDKKRYIVEHFFGFNGKDVMSQAEMGRTLGMSYQGVACNCNTVIGQIRRDTRLMSTLNEFRGR